MQDLHFSVPYFFISLDQGCEFVSFYYPSALTSVVSFALLCVIEIFPRPKEEQLSA